MISKISLRGKKKNIDVIKEYLKNRERGFHQNFVIILIIVKGNGIHDVMVILQ